MGLSCKKQTGKFKSIMRKMENELEKEKRLAKDRKEAKKNKTSKQISSFYDELKKIHKEHFCDWRFGQLCSNFFGWLVSEKKVDLFFPEEDQMIKYIREFAGIKEDQSRKQHRNRDKLFIRFWRTNKQRSNKQTYIYTSSQIFHFMKIRLCIRFVGW